MPITKSAKKALRQSAKRKVANTARKEAYKGAVKDLRKAIVAKGGNAQELFAKAMKSLDKAAKTKAIKKNKASRLKSRLAKALNKAAS